MMPADWQPLIGHSATWNKLLAFHRKGQLPHALLFHGPPNIGKHALARRFARHLNCLAAEEPLAADHCPCLSCLRAQKNLHPDIHEIFPVGSVLSISQIRRITELSTQTPQMKKYTIFIVDGLDTLQTAAANSFLKTLEEPPGPVQFLLLCHNRSRLLKTILSRVTSLYCPPPPAALVPPPAWSKRGFPSPDNLPLLKFLFERRIGLYHQFLESGGETPPPPTSLNEALETYLHSFDAVAKTLAEKIREGGTIPDLLELSQRLTGQFVAKFTVPRFYLVQALVDRPNKPLPSTLYYLANTLEEGLQKGIRRVREELEEAIVEVAKKMHEQGPFKEYRELIPGLVNQRGNEEGREFFHLCGKLAATAARSAFFTDPEVAIAIKKNLPSMVEKYGIQRLHLLYNEAEQSVQNIHKNGALFLQLAVFLLKFT